MFNSLIKTIGCGRSFVRNFANVITPGSTHSLRLAETYTNNYRAPREVWIENFNTIDEQKLDIIKLHPDIFAVAPRIDIIHQNVTWQRKFRWVRFASTKTRAEVRGGGKKPWPQKGQGRARHGSIRSPLFRGGGIAHGPRAGTTHFYMLPFYARVYGLVSTLSIKLAQDDLHVVNDLDIPTDDPEFLKSLMEQRKWGPSMLLVDTEDIIPENLALSTDRLSYVNVMPAYGLNVYSMLKHDTLIMTERAVRYVEDKLLYQIHRIDGREMQNKFRLDM